jgi:hypothetical protein
MTWDPIAEPEAADYVLLAGKRSPGLCEIVGAGSPRDWDVRKGYGTSGAFSVFTGANLAHFSIMLRLYTRQDWADWYAWKPLVDKLPKRRFSNGKDSGALDIQHPILAALGIKAIGVENVGQPVQTDHGEWTIEIKAIEFRRPKFSLAKPEGATATPVDPVEEQIIKPLTEQLQRLASEE